MTSLDAPRVLAPNPARERDTEVNHFVKCEEPDLYNSFFRECCNVSHVSKWIKKVASDKCFVCVLGPLDGEKSPSVLSGKSSASIISSVMCSLTI